MTENLISMTHGGTLGLDMLRQSSTVRASTELRNRLSHPTSVSPEMMAKIEKTAMEFESVFLTQMLETSFQGISSNPFATDGEEGQGGYADDTYRSMMLQQYGTLMARSGGIGIAQNIKQTMLSLQEVAHAG